VIKVSEEAKQDSLEMEVTEETVEETSSVEENGDKVELENCKQQLQRLYADFDNYKKRTAREKSELIKNANEDLILDILPVLDNLERAYASAEKSQQIESVLTGMKMILNQMQGVLSKAGVNPVEETGVAFDPHCHQVLMQVECDGLVEENTVVEVLQKGYYLNNKMIRPAMVKVAKGN